MNRNIIYFDGAHDGFVEVLESVIPVGLFILFWDLMSEAERVSALPLAHDTI